MKGGRFSPPKPGLPTPSMIPDRKDGWSGDAAALSPEQAADAILALSGPVSGMDTSSVAGVPCSQAGSHTGGLTPLDKELLAAAKCALGLITGNMDGDWNLGDAAEMLRAALAKAEAPATEAQHSSDLTNDWRCAGCCAAQDDTVRRCDCITPLLVRGWGSSMETVHKTEAQHAGQWRPIESAPRDGTEIIVNVPVWRGGFIVAAAHWVRHDDHGGDWWWANENSGDYYASPIHDDHGEPTHWQPLPAPPAAPPSPAPPSSEREGSWAGERS